MPHRSSINRVGIGNLVTLPRYDTSGDIGRAKAVIMSATVPIVALSALIVLSLVAKQLAYLMTSTSLQFVTAALALWFLASFWILG